MNLLQLRERMAAAITEARALGVKSSEGTITDDESTRLDALIVEINDLGPQIVKAGERSAALDNLVTLDAQYNQPATRAVATLVPHGENGHEPNANGSVTERMIDMRSPGRIFVTSDEYREVLDQKLTKSRRVTVDRPDHRNPEDFLPANGMVTEREARALVYTGTTVGPMIPPMDLPGIRPFDYRPLRVRDLFLNARTTSNLIQFVQETAGINAAAEVPEATGTSGGGYTAALKPESAIGFSVANTPVATIATWIPVTRQILEDVPQMESLVNGRLMQFIAQREDAEILVGDGTGANLRGVLATSGIQVLDSAYFGTPGNELPTVGAAATDLDRIRRARTMISVVGRAQADGIVLHPYDSEKFDELKDANGQYLIANPRQSGEQSSPLWGVRVVESEVMTPGTALVGAFRTMAAVFDRAKIQLFVADQHSDFFTHNLLVILAESRLAVAIFRPSAFATVELAA